MKQFNLIGLTSVARAGKDTFCNVLKEYCKRNNLKSVSRIALADELKEECADYLQDNFNLNVYTIKKEEKDRIRPFLVWYGKQKRIQTKGQYWTNILQTQLNDCLILNYLPVCTDIRYDEYENDEYYWVRKNHGVLIHISRYDILQDNMGQFKRYIAAANEEEKKNDPILKSKSDYLIEWPTLGPDPSYDQLFPYCEKVLKELFLNV